MTTNETKVCATCGGNFVDTSPTRNRKHCPSCTFFVKRSGKSSSYVLNDDMVSEHEAFISFASDTFEDHPLDNLTNPEDVAFSMELDTILDVTLATTLTIKEEAVVRLYTGYTRGIGSPDLKNGSTFAEIGAVLGISSQRASSVYKTAIKKLKHPKQSRWLKNYVQDVSEGWCVSCSSLASDKEYLIERCLYKTGATEPHPFCLALIDHLYDLSLKMDELRSRLSKAKPYKEKYPQPELPSKKDTQTEDTSSPKETPRRDRSRHNHSPFGDRLRYAHLPQMDGTGSGGGGITNGQGRGGDLNDILGNLLSELFPFGDGQREESTPSGNSSSSASPQWGISLPDGLVLPPDSVEDEVVHYTIKVGDAFAPLFNMSLAMPKGIVQRYNTLIGEGFYRCARSSNQLEASATISQLNAIISQKERGF